MELLTNVVEITAYIQIVGFSVIGILIAYIAFRK